MMFKSKKKTDLPARPEPPTWEEMEEDLKATTNADVIFTLAPLSTDTQESDKNSEDQSQEELFQQAKEFVLKNDELLENMELLQKQKEDLREAADNLKKMVENVRQEALAAINCYKA